jgi:hypothetical protein
MVIVSKPTPVTTNTVTTAPAAAVPVVTYPVVTAPVVTAPVITVPVQKTESSAISKPDTFPLIAETVVSKDTVSETVQPQSTPPAQPISEEPPATPSVDSVAVSKPVPTIPVQEPPIPQQNIELKVEIADKVSPPVPPISPTPQTPPIPANTDAFLPIQTTPQVNAVPAQQLVSIPLTPEPSQPEPSQPEPSPPEPSIPKQLPSESHFKFKVANEPVTIPVVKPITEQAANQQPKIVVRSDTLKFTAPNHVQPETLQEPSPKLPEPQTTTATIATTKIVPKTIENITPEPETTTATIATTKIVPKTIENITPEPQTTTATIATTKIVPKTIENIVPKPETTTTKIVSKPDLTLIPLEVDSAQKTESEHKSMPELKRESILRSVPEDVFVLKKIEKKLPKLKPEIEIAEKIALNLISGETVPRQSVELTENEEPIGFARTRQVPPAVIQRKVEVNETVDEFLKPRENFGEHPIFSTSSKDVSQEEEAKEGEEAGFARSGRYSKKTQQQSSE